MKPLLIALACLVVAPALAQDYPTRPIRLIVPTAPGGSSDLVSRLLAEEAGKILGQPIVIENRPGANGNVGMDSVAKSEKDGYMLGNCAIGVCSVNSLFYKMPFDFERELKPVFWTTSLTNMLVVKNDGRSGHWTISSGSRSRASSTTAPPASAAHITCRASC